MQSGIQKHGIYKITKDKSIFVDDQVAVEAPLEMRLTHGASGHRQAQPLSITMRTPGQDLDLTTGFLFTEGIISGIADIQDQQQRQRDVVNTSLKSHVRVQPAELQRHFYTTSSCGVCGKTSIDMVKTKTVYRPHTSKFSIKHNVLWRLQQQLKSRQILFNQTGGIHAAGLFNNKGELVLIREDVGRHNAVDKLIGAGLKMNVVPLYEHFIMVSGRASFELIQKASMAGLPMLVAVGAPSSLAVELAEEQGMTLIGFLKNNSFNIYSKYSRIHHEGKK